MRKLAIMAALASTALATPAVAVDNSWYVGVEGGAMIVEDANLDFDGFTADGLTALEIDDAIQLDHKVGFDVDLIGGYDFGGFRVEAEAGWKRASLDQAEISGLLIDDATFFGDVDGSVRV